MSTVDPVIEAAIRETLGRQGFRDLIGYEVSRLGPGTCEMTLDVNLSHTQQHKLVHGGVLAAMADVAAGCAAITLAPPGTETVTVEFKMNYLRPARGEQIVVRARVLKPGRTIAVMETDVFANDADGESHVATALVTYSLIQGPAG